MFLRCILLLLIVVFGGSSFAQVSVYEFDYSFKAGKTLEKYNAFMVRYEDGTGFIRVRFIDAGIKCTCRG